MTKTRQYHRYAFALGAIFMAAAIITPAAQAQRPTCNGGTVTLSPGCTPVYFFPAHNPACFLTKCAVPG